MSFDWLRNSQLTDDELRELEGDVCEPLEHIAAQARLALETPLSPKQHKHLDAIRTSARALGLATRDAVMRARLENAPLSVLIVGDNAASRRIIVESLSRQPISATEADGPARAMETLAEARRRGTPFALILLDVDTTIDGAQALAEDIVRGAATPATPILLVGSSGGLKDLAHWKELGVAAFIVKPVRQSDLVAILAEVLGIELPAGLPAARHAGSLAARHVRVLLAEGHGVNRRFSERLLASRGHRVTVVGSGADVLAAISNTDFDVLLIDRQLHDMDAIQVAAIIRKHEQSRSARVRILAVADRVAGGDRERCLSAGIDGYLQKPLDRQRLFDAIERTVWRENMATDGDEHLLARASRVFLDGGPKLLQAVKTSIDVGDAVGLQQWAHTIKESAEECGAAGVVDAARTLEILGRHGILDGAPEACQRLEAEIKRLMVRLSDLIQRSSALP
jgi:CheY-like chemotaxis protein